MDDVEIRLLTEADIIAVNGRSLGHTCQGWAVFYKGEIAAIAGVLFTRPLVLAFSQIKSGLGPVPKRVIWLTAQELWKNIKALGQPVLYAIAAPSIPTAPAFLERLGFTHIETSVRGEIFKWAIQ